MATKAVVSLLFCLIFWMIIQSDAKLFFVGGQDGWTTKFNYTRWAEDMKFYKGDLLEFVYDVDRLDVNRLDVIQVDKHGYDTCSVDNVIHNWTAGTGTDVIPLKAVGSYFFITSKRFCFEGLKLCVQVFERPSSPPPSSRSAKISAITLLMLILIIHVILLL